MIVQEILRLILEHAKSAMDLGAIRRGCKDLFAVMESLEDADDPIDYEAIALDACAIAMVMPAVLDRLEQAERERDAWHTEVRRRTSASQYSVIRGAVRRAIDLDSAAGQPPAGGE